MYLFALLLINNINDREFVVLPDAWDRMFKLLQSLIKENHASLRSHNQCVKV